MKRNLDLIREILIKAEEADGGISDCDLVNDKYTIAEVAFNVELMRERGLIEASIDHAGLNDKPYSVDIDRITWEGYDYLDAIRSRKVWEKARQAISAAVGDTSLSVVKETCQMVAQSLIKQQLGL